MPFQHWFKWESLRRHGSLNLKSYTKNGFLFKEFTITLILWDITKITQSVCLQLECTVEDGCTFI